MKYADLEEENNLLRNPTASVSNKALEPSHMSIDAKIKELEDQLEQVIEDSRRQVATSHIDATMQTEALRALLEEAHIQLKETRDQLEQVKSESLAGNVTSSSFAQQAVEAELFTLRSTKEQNESTISFCGQTIVDFVSRLCYFI